MELEFFGAAREVTGSCHILRVNGRMVLLDCGMFHVERQRMLNVFGEAVPLRARVEILNGYSAHADRRELATWLGAIRKDAGRPPPVWLVHGEPPSQAALAASLRESGYTVEMPPYAGDRVSL